MFPEHCQSRMRAPKMPSKIVDNLMKQFLPFTFKDVNISLLACKLIRLLACAMRHTQGQCDDGFSKDDKNFESMFV